MSSRDAILNALRAARRPFGDLPPAPADYLHVTPPGEGTPAALTAQFVREAQALHATVYQSRDAAEALAQLLALLANEPAVLAWAWDAIPLPGLRDGLAAAGITVADDDDVTVRVGISGANAALAATGTLILYSGAGRARATSLLPPVHIAVITADQIVADFESWIAAAKAAGLDRFRQAANIIAISGPSRTADIAMELILGMHGPGELHIFILP